MSYLRIDFYEWCYDFEERVYNMTLDIVEYEEPEIYNELYFIPLDKFISKKKKTFMKNLKKRLNIEVKNFNNDLKAANYNKLDNKQWFTCDHFKDEYIQKIKDKTYNIMCPFRWIGFLNFMIDNDEIN